MQFKKKSDKMPQPVTCNSCHQVITDEVALANERKRQEQREKEKAEEKAVSKAAEVELKVIRSAIKTINAKGIFKVTEDTWSEGDLKDPIAYICFRVEIKAGKGRSGIKMDVEDINGKKDIYAFLKAFGATI
jgi:hypothetical protein